MVQAEGDVHALHAGGDFVIFTFVLSKAGACVERRTFAESVFVHSTDTVLLEGDRVVVHVFIVTVVSGNRKRAAGQRGSSAEMEVVALDEAIGFLLAVKRGHIELFVLAVLGAEEGLRHAEVVVHAEADGVGVTNLAVIVSVSSGEGAVAVENRIGYHGDVQSTGGVGQAQSGVTVVVTDAGVFRALRLEGVLSVAREAVGFGGHEGDHVVVTSTIKPVAGADVVAVAAVEGVTRGLEHVIRAGAGREGAHAAERHRAVGGVQGQAGFTIEELVVISTAHGTRIGLEAVFELEAHRVAVAQIFRALEAELGSTENAGIHRELIGVLTVEFLRVRTAERRVVVHEARVNRTVNRHVGGKSRRGKSGSHGHREKLLLHGNIS